MVPLRVRPSFERAGSLIAVEGIDGSGKSTVAREITDALEQVGRRAVLVSRATAPEIADGYCAEHLRMLGRLIWDYPETAKTSALGFPHWAHLLASWFAAVDHTVIRPAVEDEACVVADSWYYKFAARFALGVGLKQALSFFRDIAVPDTVVWLDVPPETCLARRRTLRSTERGEWQDLDDGGGAAFVEYQGKVRRMYRALATACSWEVVVATDRASVTAEVGRRLREIREPRPEEPDVRRRDPGDERVPRLPDEIGAS
jgi:thymidylate kinase